MLPLNPMRRKKDEFYNPLENRLVADVKIVLGDYNAEIGETIWEN